MNTYPGGDAGGGAEGAGSREWVFGALATPGYRERCDQLAQLDLQRRPGCEPCLQSLVTDKWTAETEHHLGWCDSCRAAAVALGPAVRAAGAPHRRLALWLAVAAGAVILVPLAGGKLIDNPFAAHDARGGVAHAVGSAKVVPVARSKASGVTKAAGGAAVVGAQASAGAKVSADGKVVVGTKAVVGGKVVIRAKPAAQRAVPLTKHGSRALPHTT
jgi:hypothetical protein